MTAAADVYGSRPDRLPRGTVQRRLLPDGRPGWVPRDGVTLLSHDEHVRAERATRALLPRRADGTLDEERAPHVVSRSHPAEPAAVAAEVQRLAAADVSFVMVPSALEVPSLRVDAAVAADLAAALAQSMAELTVVAEPSGVVVQYVYFEDVVLRVDPAWSPTSRHASG